MSIFLNILVVQSSKQDDLLETETFLASDSPDFDYDDF